MENETLNKQEKYKNINQNEFGKEVLEASKNSLIVVDFWAPWCGPCKDLGPRIEKAVGLSKGKAKLVKINIDENQEIAAQLQIQSIPTVFAFKNAKLVNAFQGSIPENEIIKFIEKGLGEKLEANLEEKIKEARDFFNKEMFKESNDIVEEIISSDSQNPEAFELLIKNNTSLGNLDIAKEIIDSLDEEMNKNQNVQSAINAFNLANDSGNISEDELFSLIEKDPLNILNNKKLSDVYFNKKEYDKAFALILDLYIKIKKEKKNEVKSILIGYFDILGPTHEKTKETRRKLSSLIFS